MKHLCCKMEWQRQCKQLYISMMSATKKVKCIEESEKVIATILDILGLYTYRGLFVLRLFLSFLKFTHLETWVLLFYNYKMVMKITKFLNIVHAGAHLHRYTHPHFHPSVCEP